LPEEVSETVLNERCDDREIKYWWTKWHPRALKQERLNEHELMFYFQTQCTAGTDVFNEMCRIVEKEKLKGIELRLDFWEYMQGYCGYREQTLSEATGEAMHHLRDDDIQFGEECRGVPGSVLGPKYFLSPGFGVFE
jgi:hypothetical protein